MLAPQGGGARVSSSRLGSRSCLTPCCRPSSRPKRPGKRRNSQGVFRVRGVAERAAPPYLRPAAVPTDHVCVGHGGEERVRRQVVGQTAEELGDVDEVHLQQDVLEEAQDPETRPEQTLLTVTAEDVPHTARHVQRQRLTVEGEDPRGGGGVMEHR